MQIKKKLKKLLREGIIGGDKTGPPPYHNSFVIALQKEKCYPGKQIF